MIPTREEAEKELKLAGKLNPGPWIEHSINAGLAAQKIVELCSNSYKENSRAYDRIWDRSEP